MSVEMIAMNKTEPKASIFVTESSDEVCAFLDKHWHVYSTIEGNDTNDPSKFIDIQLELLSRVSALYFYAELKKHEISSGKKPYADIDDFMTRA